jgi:soluble lytic murein transglycosylase-like protein
MTWIMTWVLLFFLGQALGQDARSQADRVRSLMQSSLAQQRRSIETQVRAAGAAPGISYKEVPWTPLPTTPAPGCDPLSQPELNLMIGEASAKNGVSPELVREVVRQESGFKPCAVSSRGAEGIMQLMPATQSQFAVANPFNVKENLDAGTKLLKELLDRYSGDLTKALSAYNAGAGRVDKSGAVPDIPETKNYVLSILGELNTNSTRKGDQK